MLYLDVLEIPDTVSINREDRSVLVLSLELRDVDAQGVVARLSQRSRDWRIFKPGGASNINQAILYTKVLPSIPR